MLVCWKNSWENDHILNIVSQKVMRWLNHNLVEQEVCSSCCGPMMEMLISRRCGMRGLIVDIWNWVMLYYSAGKRDRVKKKKFAWSKSRMLAMLDLVMVWHRLSKSCYFAFFVVLPHPFSYYIALIPYHLILSLLLSTYFKKIRQKVRYVLFEKNWRTFYQWFIHNLPLEP